MDNQILELLQSAPSVESVVGELCQQIVRLKMKVQLLEEQIRCGESNISSRSSEIKLTIAKMRVERNESKLAAACERVEKAKSQLVASQERVKNLDWSVNHLVAVLQTVEEKLYVAGYQDCQRGYECLYKSKFNPSASSTLTTQTINPSASSTLTNQPIN